MNENDYSIDYPYIKLPIDCAVRCTQFNQNLNSQKKKQRTKFIYNNIEKIRNIKKEVHVKAESWREKQKQAV